MIKDLKLTFLFRFSGKIFLGWGRNAATLLALSISMSLTYNDLCAQEPSYIHYTTRDGLPSSTVYQIIQDKKGFIWFATDAGVCRYDGRKFKSFTTKDGLVDGEIITMFADSKDNVWFGSGEGGVSCFQNESFLNIRNKKIRIENNVKDPIVHFFEDSEGIIWVVPSNNGLVMISPEDSLIFFTKEFGYSFTLGKAIWEKNGKVYCLTSLSSSIVPRKSFINSIIPKKYQFYTESGVAAIFNNTLFRPVGNLIISYNLDTLVEKNLLSPKIVFQQSYQDTSKWEKVNSISYDNNLEELWIGSARNGAFSISLNSDQKSTIINLLPQKRISSILIDKEGNYWFSTLDEGIFFLGSRNITKIFSRQGQLLKKISTIIPNTSRQVWIGANKGLYLVKEEDKSVNMIENKEYSFNPIGSQNLSRTNFFWDNRQAFSIQNDKIQQIKDIPRGAIKLIDLDPDGNMICSVHRGTFVKKNNEWNTLWRLNKENKSLRTYGIEYLSHDSAYIGTQDGLRLLVGDSLHGKFPHPELGGNISKVEKDSFGIVWGISSNHGAFYQIKGKDFVFVTEKDGMPGSSCKSICFGKPGEAWIGTNSGLCKVNYDYTGKTTKVTTQSYDEADGLPSNEINALAYLGDSIFVGTNEGLAVFNPEVLNREILPPPTYITRFSINDIDTTYTKDLVLGYDQNDILIEYTGISFRNRKKVVYSYILEGADKEWKTTRSAQIKYPSLPPGDYSFKVISSIENKIQSTNIASINFKILKPWWQTAWFYIICGVLGAGLIFLYFILRIKSIRRRNEYEMRISELQSSALRLQMNPHFIFNTLNSIHYFINSNDKKSARHYLSSFGKLIRGLLEYSLRSGIMLEEEKNLLELYLSLEAIRLENRLQYSVEIPKEIDASNTEIPVMAIQPFVENAIWHGISHKEGPGKITISFFNQPRHIVCRVEDDGIGRKNAQGIYQGSKHLSLSTKSIESRLEMMNKNTGISKSVVYHDLLDSNNQPRGTQVDIYLPIEF
ncbi:MAG: histidine kinase [Bacteroidia bacterium]|nr:histidine kinase [Bacteroidia bacterium]